jgi:hypothetical protein
MKPVSLVLDLRTGGHHRASYDHDQYQGQNEADEQA